MFKNKKFKKAFTLVEMLIVIIIIGILMWALLPKLKWAQERARDTARKANLTTVSTALEMYFNDEGSYPTWSCVSNISSKLVPTYVSELPSDPQKWRIAFWTKAGWCTGWDYAYSAMSRKWSRNAWSVIVANTEAQGKVWNFILPQASASAWAAINIVFSWNTTAIGSTSIAGDDSIAALSVTDMADASTNSATHISDASYAAKFTCSSTTLWTTGTMCNNAIWVIAWEALANNAMVYVIFN